LEPIRLQEYGVGIFEDCPTKSALKKILKKQYITVNGKVANSGTYIIGGETLVLNLPEKASNSNRLIFPIEILFEDEYLAVIEKPAGILVSGNTFQTIANALPQNLNKSSLPDTCVPQPVHRLDYATTGALLIGKTSSAIRALNKLFKEKVVLKTYYAVTIEKMESEGEVKTSIDGKASHSEYRICEWVPSNRFGRLNLVALKPKTGRRHQLRKHMAVIGNPILGDKEYGIDGLVLNGKGLYLHAHSLKFKHPFTNESLEIISKLPKKFKKIFPEISAETFSG
jgi:23S rRNA pseudouridine1911/1915/1917 synthase